MIWLIPIVFFALIAFLVYRTLRGRRVSRTSHESRLAEHKPELSARKNNVEHTPKEHSLLELGDPDEKSDTNIGMAKASADSARNQPLPAPYASPSLLYAERKQHAFTSATAAASELVTDATQDQSSDSMDLTAETATRNNHKVGLPANSNEYDLSHAKQQGPAEQKAKPTVATSSIAAAGTVMSHNAISAHTTDIDIGGDVDATEKSTVSNTDHNVDFELGDNAQVELHDEPTSVENLDEQSEEHDVEQNVEQNVEHDLEHDEVLDFGDLTVDISEMLKELNLRETDSPRLELEPNEFQQLRTGEPGEVEPEKIENVAGKLRNMLQ